MFTRSHLRVASVALLLALGLVGCRSNGGAASDARISVDAGRLEITLGGKTGVLPADDVSKDVPTVTRDEAGRRLAYRTSSGKSRTVYLVGDGLFAGPLVASPVDFRAVPELEQVLGTLFELASDRRADLVREVRRERGDSGVVRLLVDSAHVDDPAWEEGRKQLSPESESALREELAKEQIDVRVFAPPHTSTEAGRRMPLDLPKIFTPEWVASEFVTFLRGRRPRALPGGNGMLLFLQRVSPRLASRIMAGLGFKALSKVLGGELPPRRLASPTSPAS